METRDRCYDYLNIFAEKFGEKKFLTTNKAKLCKILIITLVIEKNANFVTENWQKLPKIVIITLVFEKNANFFRRKLAKIAENCDHNIDPWRSVPRNKFLTWLESFKPGY
jgi:hypothetical protein